MKVILDNLKFIVVGLAALVLVWLAMPRRYSAKDFQFDEFGALPAWDNGRSKPMDTVARMSLMTTSGRQSYQETEEHSDGTKSTKRYPAVKWLLDVFTVQVHQPAPQAKQFKVFSITDAALLANLGLKPREDFFAYEEFETPLKAILKRGEEAFKRLKDTKDELPADEQQLYGKAAGLSRQVGVIMYLTRGPSAAARTFRIENDQLLGILGLEPRKGFQYSLLEILPKWGNFDAQVKRVRDVDTKNRDSLDNAVKALYESVALYQSLAYWETPHPVPPPEKSGWWQSFAKAQDEHNPEFKSYVDVLAAYSRGDVEDFNEKVKQLAKTLQQSFPTDVGNAHLEGFFNRLAPFETCAFLYGAVFLLICGSWFGQTQTLQTAAYWLAAFLVGVHALALLMRIFITGYPPVINLYSSAVFIGWGCVLLCLVLERFFPNGLSTMVASILGGATLIIAHHLAASGDTMDVLVPVLRTGFWLATHVVCITLGYTATFVAGFFGIVYVFRGVLTRTLDRETAQNLTKMIYGTVCFATLLSFTGTVLGGIWADQSWGRFWGWDPKENGALIIVLWNALLLHARWGGMVKSRGIALLAIGGNIVTAWSWFGVNMLGVGLHSYGFMGGAFLWMSIFVGSQLLLIGIGSLPEKYWKSLNVPAPVFSPAAAVKPTLALTNGSAAPATAIAAAPVMNPRKAKNKVKMKK